MITTAEHGSLRLVTLDRPEKQNALHPEMISRLGELLTQTSADERVRVVVLTGSGKSFSAGLDLDHFSTLDDHGRVEYMRSAFVLFQQLYELKQPVIAAVNGPAIAGGFDLAAFCDIRLCASTARFAQSEILLGLTQIMYPIYKVIGFSRAKELAFTGLPITAEDAYRIGLVSAVHSSDDLLSRALALAESIASRPPEALFATKRLSREMLELGPVPALERMLDTIIQRLRSQEHRTALESYLIQLRQRNS